MMRWSSSTAIVVILGGRIWLLLGDPFGMTVTNPANFSMNSGLESSSFMGDLNEPRAPFRRRRLLNIRHMIKPIATRPAIEPERPPMIARFRPGSKESAMAPIVVPAVGAALTAAFPASKLVDTVESAAAVSCEDVVTHVTSGDLPMVEFAGHEEIAEYEYLEDEFVLNLVDDGLGAIVCHCDAVGAWIVI